MQRRYIRELLSSWRQPGARALTHYPGPRHSERILQSTVYTILSCTWQISGWLTPRLPKHDRMVRKGWRPTEAQPNET
jgi:hypothetical protein